MTIKVWPNGDLEFGTATVDGQSYVMITCNDSTTGAPLEIGFRLEHFITVTDQMSDFARRVLDDMAKK